jgi:hypothetical protein
MDHRLNFSLAKPGNTFTIRQIDFVKTEQGIAVNPDGPA